MEIKLLNEAGQKQVSLPPRYLPSLKPPKLQNIHSFNTPVIIKNLRQLGEEAFETTSPQADHLSQHVPEFDITLQRSSKSLVKQPWQKLQQYQNASTLPHQPDSPNILIPHRRLLDDSPHSNLIPPSLKTSHSYAQSPSARSSKAQGKLLEQEQQPKYNITYQQWRDNQRKQQTKAKALKNYNYKELKVAIRKATSKIRSDAFAGSGKVSDREENLETGIRKKLERLKQISISEDPFTYSLSKVHDKSFLSKILPSVQNYQCKRSPLGASYSKSPNLLRNTFSIEMYQEFLKQKQKLAKNKPQQQKDNLATTSRNTSNQQALGTIKEEPGMEKSKLKLSPCRKKTTKKALSTMSSPKQPTMRLSFAQKMSQYKQAKQQEDKKHQYIEMLKTGQQKLKANFFEELEMKDMDFQLIEKIQYEINKIFNQEMAKFRGVTSGYNSMLKRKNLLEAKLFKKRYEKVQKYLNGSQTSESQMNPFKRPYRPSVFSENLEDRMMEVPANKELFENVIKEAIGDDDFDDSDEEAENQEGMTDEQIIESIRRKFRRRVLKEKRRSVNVKTKSKSFVEDFWEQIIDRSDKQSLFTKLIKNLNKSKQAEEKQNTSLQTSQQTTKKKNLRLDISEERTGESSFFITEGFQLPYLSAKPTPKNRSPFSSSRVEQNSQSSAGYQPLIAFDGIGVNLQV